MGVEAAVVEAEEAVAVEAAVEALLQLLQAPVPVPVQAAAGGSWTRGFGL